MDQACFRRAGYQSSVPRNDVLGTGNDKGLWHDVGHFLTLFIRLDTLQ